MWSADRRSDGIPWAERSSPSATTTGPPPRTTPRPAGGTATSCSRARSARWSHPVPPERPKACTWTWWTITRSSAPGTSRTPRASPSPTELPCAAATTAVADSGLPREVGAPAMANNEEKLLDYLKRVTADLRQTQRRLKDVESAGHEPVAIVGMSCRFPGGVRSPEELWELVATERDGITELPTHPERMRR